MNKTLGKYKGNDVELCSTTSGRIGEKTARILMENRVPFTKIKKYIPFYKRQQYSGARTIWVISTSPRRYCQARRIIDSMDMFYKERMVVSNY